MMPGPLSLRAFVHRFSGCTARRSRADRACSAVVGANAVETAKLSATSPRRRSTRALLKAEKRLPDHRLRHARLRRLGRRCLALRHQDQPDGSTFRHDHGRPHRPREAHGCARVVPTRPVGTDPEPRDGEDQRRARSARRTQSHDRDDRQQDLRSPDPVTISEVDFAGFRDIVNAIGSVPIYFPAPARDKETGLSIPTAGCVNLTGDQALAYVRSLVPIRDVQRRTASTDRDLRHRPHPASAVASSAVALEGGDPDRAGKSPETQQGRSTRA